MDSLDKHIENLKDANAQLGKSCPWLGTGKETGEYTRYGNKGALCRPDRKVEAGRAASRAYKVLRHLELDHLSTVRRILREELSARRDLDEETGRYMAKDLFEKCEAISDCIACSCESAVMAHHNLDNLISILQRESEST